MPWRLVRRPRAIPTGPKAAPGRTPGAEPVVDR
ncbi:hypothetical protein SSCG_02731 [Streptomyces clavuligerus]|nr:hypothetical protein SSCG_02731 [Streptomyces clavuligerus]